MNISLKVHPEALASKAGELSSEKTLVLSLMEEARREINTLSGIWKSEASDEYQGRFRQVYADAETMLTDVSGYINRLGEAASIYRAAEKNVSSTAEGLPTYGIFND